MPGAVSCRLVFRYVWSIFSQNQSIFFRRSVSDYIGIPAVCLNILLPSSKKQLPYEYLIFFFKEFFVKLGAEAFPKIEAF